MFLPEKKDLYKALFICYSFYKVLFQYFNVLPFNLLQKGASQKFRDAKRKNMNTEKNDEHGRTEQEFLAQYRPGKYEKPSLTVDMLIFTLSEDSLRLLLIQRKKHPFIDCFALPGGFVGIKESLEEAAARELREETGLDHIYMEQLYTFGSPNRDPRMRVVSVAYMALLPNRDLCPVAGDDAKEADWFEVRLETQKTGGNLLLSLSNPKRGFSSVYEVEKPLLSSGYIETNGHLLHHKSGEELAFDHAGIIAIAIERLRNKVEYTPIAFNLAGAEFTLPQLQHIYEIILGKKLYKTSFRSRMQKYILPTGRKKHVEGVVRDAVCYRYNHPLHT